MSEQITVKFSNDNSINGVYKSTKYAHGIDKNTRSYCKDEYHQIYRYNNIWKIGHIGEKVYIELPSYILEDKDNDVIDLSGDIPKRDLRI